MELPPPNNPSSLPSQPSSQLSHSHPSSDSSQIHEFPTKKLCTEHSKRSANLAEFSFTSGEITFDRCPICLKFNPKAFEYSCQTCSAYVCKFCYRNTPTPELCPLCKQMALKQLNFKEKKLLEEAKAHCPKCDIKFKLENEFTLTRHKVECQLPGWSLGDVKGGTNDVDDLIDGLLMVPEQMNELPEGFLKFCDKVMGLSGTSWNIVMEPKNWSIYSNEYLVMRKKESTLNLIFFK